MITPCSVTKDWIFQSPKIELHVHLEGSLSLSFWETHHLEIKEEIQQFQNSPVKSLPLFLNSFEKIHRALQTPQHYYEAMLDLLEQLITENVLYAEITWAPGGILEFHKVDPATTFQGIKKAIKEKKHQIDARILVDIIRNQPISLAYTVANWLLQEKPEEVVGLNFGGDEQHYKIHPFIELFQKLKNNGYKLTIHAGEAVDEEELLDSVEQASPHRIGHGTSLRTEDAASKWIRQNISVEACPSSNKTLGYLTHQKDHPVFRFKALRASINTDDRSFFSPTLSEEIEQLLSQKIMTLQELTRMQIQAVEDCFAREFSSQLKQIYHFWKNLNLE